jgi:phosphate-selective porin OprO/OprP
MKRNTVPITALLAIVLSVAVARSEEPSYPAFVVVSSPPDVPSPEVFAPAAAVPEPAALQYPRTTRMPDPATRFLGENQPQVVEQLYDRVLDLYPDRNDRQVIERVRSAVEMTEVGVDVSDEEWVEVDDLTITWGGRIHLDWVSWANDSDFGNQPNYLEFRRLRLQAAGEGYGVYFYQLEVEFAPEVDVEAEVVDDELVLEGFGVEMKDAYLGVRDVPWLGTVKMGHFFTPLSLERLTSSNDITFMERSLAHRFIPGREVGIATENGLPSQLVTWSSGFFLDEMDESRHGIVDDNQGVRLVSRFTATPYYDELLEGRHLLHLGVGYSYTRPRLRDNELFPGTEYRPVEFAARPEINRGDFVIDSDEINASQYYVVDTEIAWVHGPLSLQSEFVWVPINVLGGEDVDFYGAYAYVSYFLTGENRVYDRRNGTFRGITPYENAWFVNTPRGRSAGWGAWELACRWSYMDMTDVRDQQVNDLTVGMNWYLNQRSRLMLNWIHTMGHNSPAGVTPNPTGDILAMRMQVEF